MVYFGSSVIARTAFTAIFGVFCIALPINQHCNKAEREITGKAAKLLNSSKPFKTSAEKIQRQLGQSSHLPVV